MIAITLGDPYGIGPEVTAKALAQLDPEVRREILVIGAKNAFDYQVERLGLGPSLQGVEFFDTLPGKKVDYSRPYDLAYAQSALSALEKAVELAKSGKVSGICTAPVSKEKISEISPGFTGHTEWLKERFGVKSVEMIFVMEDLAVVLLSRHVPLREVPILVTKERVREVIERAEEFRRAMGWTGEIGVCGLNPHAGEGGLLGREEQDTIGPVVKRMRDKGIPVRGPVPADAVFRMGFRVIVAMYHDQALPVIKTVYPEAVNLTWGLPVVRTSPSHGTAFDIRDKGIASPVSMLKSIEVCIRLSRRR